MGVGPRHDTYNRIREELYCLDSMIAQQERLYPVYRQETDWGEMRLSVSVLKEMLERWYTGKREEK